MTHTVIPAAAGITAVVIRPVFEESVISRFVVFDAPVIGYELTDWGWAPLILGYAPNTDSFAIPTGDDAWLTYIAGEDGGDQTLSIATGREIVNIYESGCDPHSHVMHADIDIDIDNITERFFTESDWAELRGFRMAMEMKQS